MSTRVTKIGSRGSDLALWQAHHIQRLLRAAFPDSDFRIEVIRTKGDHVQDRSLSTLAGKGFFTKEIEEALLDGRIDLAVHSLKDLPTEPAAGLVVGAVPEREDPHDVWISKEGRGPENSPPGTRVGTSSPRRQAQLKAFRPEFVYEELRGNIPTRLGQMNEGRCDALVLARAGLARLDLLPEDAVALPFDEVLPAPGQGALAVQVRLNDERILDMVGVLEDSSTRLCVTAEREFLHVLQGGCLVPVGAHAQVRGEELQLSGVVADLSGNPVFRATRSVELEPPMTADSEMLFSTAHALGAALAEQLLAEGAAPVLDRVREILRARARPPERGEE